MSNVPADVDGVLRSRIGAASVLTLDRPQSLNAITIAMRRQLLSAIPPLARDPEIYASVIRASPAGKSGSSVFSAGGDIREMARLAANDPGAAAAVLAEEHRLCWVVDCFSKPTVSLIDGLVIGLAAGLTLRGTHRVAAAGYRFSMPETRIGFIPNDGVAHALARMPDQIGMYLGLTGQRIGAADALALGLVTHCIDARHFTAIEAALGEAQPVDPLLDGLHSDPGPAVLDPLLRDTIRRCFGQPTLPAIAAELSGVAASGGPTAVFALRAAADLAVASPLALAITQRHIRDAAHLDLRQVLIRDSRLAARLFQHSDFLQGVTVVLGGASPQMATRSAGFRPSNVADVSAAMVERFFAATGQTEFPLPTRAEMQSPKP